MRTVIIVIRTSIFYIMLLVTAGVLILFFYSKGEIERFPNILGYKPLTILSNSMQPTFNAGDMILINVDKTPQMNDVITYKHPSGMLVTHRVVGKVKKDGETLYQTKGDNNNTGDRVLVPRSSIFGIESFVIPNAGYVAKFISGPIGFYLFILLPILAVMIIEIFSRLGLFEKKEIERKKLGREGE